METEKILKKSVLNPGKNWITLLNSANLSKKNAVTPVNFHLYHYAGNNPVRYTDPDGRDFIYFFFTYNEKSIREQLSRAIETPFVYDDIVHTALNGTTVIPKVGTKEEILKALQDDETCLIIFSGHGSPIGGVYTADGKCLTPEELKGIHISKNLQTVIFENCHQGTDWIKKKWENVFDESVDIVAWKGKTYIPESISFNSAGLFDRQKKRLRNYIDKTLKRIKQIKMQETWNRIMNLKKTEEYNKNTAAQAGDIT